MRSMNARRRFWTVDGLLGHNGTMEEVAANPSGIVGAPQGLP